MPDEKEPPMKVEVRPGQLWEFTDRSGIARRARVVRVADPIEGVRQVYLRRVGSGPPMHSTLHRLECQSDGARLVEDIAAPHPPEPMPARKETTDRQPVRHETLRGPRMSADERRTAIASAKRLQERGLPLGEIAQTLGVLPEFVEGWLRELPRS